MGASVSPEGQENAVVAGLQDVGEMRRAHQRGHVGRPEAQQRVQLKVDLSAAQQQELGLLWADLAQEARHGVSPLPPELLVEPRALAPVDLRIWVLQEVRQRDVFLGAVVTRGVHKWGPMKGPRHDHKRQERRPVGADAGHDGGISAVVFDRRKYEVQALYPTR